MKLRPLFLGIAWGIASLLGACASDAGRLPPGSSRDDALAVLGPPTARFPIDGGERLQCSRMPMGWQVYNADFDSAGKLRSVTQVMEEWRFHQDIKPGQWKVDDVRRHFGLPSQVEHVPSWAGEIWSYRFLEMNNRRFLHVYLDPSGVVRRYHSTDEQLLIPD